MALNQNCSLIAVIGGKGGVGKSVFAANFACALNIELRTQVLLIDADTRGVGDQNIIMGLKPNKTLKELGSFQGSFASLPLNSIVTKHPASGLDFIGAIRSPDETLNITPDSLNQVLEFFSRNYKFIIVDCGNDMGPIQMTILQEATAIMLVTTPEVLVVTQTQKLLNELMSNTFPRDMCQLVVNKASPAGLSPQVIASQLQLQLMGVIPQDDVTSTGALQRYTPFVVGAPKAPISMAHLDVARKLTGGTLQRLKALARPKPMIAAATEAGASASPQLNAQGLDAWSVTKIRIHNELIRTVDLKKLFVDSKNDESKEKELREKTKREITAIVDREVPNSNKDDRSKLIKEVLEEALGLGPLEDLLADPDVTEVMVNGAKKIFVEKAGKVSLSSVTFTSNAHLRRIIERIVTPLGRQINESTPYVDARLKDGSRVNAVIEPLAIDGPAVTIRKFKKGGISPEKYIGYGSMTKNMIDFMRICVENGANIVISGGTGSGKTSLLNMMSSFIPENERVITVEDAAELQLQQDHVVRLETRPSSMEGTNAVTIRDLIKNALRMRPDRIIVGECRDGAALDMLQAMNTGHDGSMTTTHANSPRECVARLETLCMMSGMELPVRAIREQIAGAVHIIIQISRLSDHTRKIMSITEVSGMQGEVVSLGEVFKFDENGRDKNRKITGQFIATGYIPKIIQKLSDRGVVIPREIFSNDPKTAQAAAVQAAASTAPKQSSPGQPVMQPSTAVKPGMPVPPNTVKKSG